MASNYTEHYDLCQWEATDQVQRTEFNADNAKIDAALDALAGQVAEKADGDDLAALSETVAGHTAALALRGNCQIYTTTYTGTGTVSRTFSFPKQPLLVIIGGPSIYLVAVRGITYLLSTESGESNSLTGTWSGTSLTVAYNRNLGGGDRRACNASGSSYRIVALLDMSE